jgi:hypothetical protein
LTRCLAMPLEKMAPATASRACNSHIHAHPPGGDCKQGRAASVLPVVAVAVLETICLLRENGAARRDMVSLQFGQSNGYSVPGGATCARVKPPEREDQAACQCRYTSCTCRCPQIVEQVTYHNLQSVILIIVPLPCLYIPMALSLRAPTKHRLPSLRCCCRRRFWC